MLKILSTYMIRMLSPVVPNIESMKVPDGGGVDKIELRGP
jgi:hypothetical protein